jgi:hypothetical protein
MTIAFIVILIAFGLMANANHNTTKHTKRLEKDIMYLHECLKAADILYANDVWGKKEVFK